ncbi:MAG TPA: tetratricopeptide repeat protein [Tepidisphaeraceae bacterium]|nr:tetratricopeptide repeat protein [Tepidisphaeraceae bacterium]
MAEAMFERGQIFGNLKKNQQAISDFTWVVEHKGVDSARIAEVIADRAWYYMEEKKFEKAIADCTRVINDSSAAEPIVLQCLANRGHSYAETKQYRQAVADYTRVLETKGANAAYRSQALYRRADCYDSLGEYDGELADCTNLIGMKGAKSGDVYGAHCLRAHVYYVQTKFQLAIADDTFCIETASADSPEFLAEELTRRAYGYSRVAAYQAGIADCTRAINMDGVSASARCDAHLNRARNYYASGKLDDAEKDFQCVLHYARATTTQTARALIGRSDILYDHCRFDEELAELSRVIAMKDVPTEQLFNALCDRGTTLEDMGREAEATADFTRVIDSHDDSFERMPDAIAHRASSIAQQGDYARAASEAARVMAMNGVPNAASQTALLAHALATWKLGRSDIAKKDFDKAILTASPNSRAWIYIDRGSLYYDDGQTDAAIADSTRAIELNGISSMALSRALLNRAMELAAHGNRDGATADYKRVVSITDAPAADKATAQKHLDSQTSR